MGRKKTSSKKKAIATAASYEELTADERKAKALEFKTIGNTAFAAGNYAEAKKAFSECIAIEPTEQVYFSNRSATYVALNKLNSAIEDGKECVKLAPAWWKGYSRLATAYQGKGKWEQAIKTFALGVNVDPAQDTIRNQLTSCMKAAETEWDEKSLSNLMGNLHIADKPITQDDENFSHVIGIDLGTTYSCVGVFKDGNVEIIANSEGQRTTPSVVSFSGEERLIGDAAKSSAPSNPLNTVYDAKRMIGSSMDDEKVIADVNHFPFEVKEGDSKKPVIVVDYQGEKREFSPEEISAMVLTRMKETAEAFLGTEVDKAVVTVPAYFNDSQRVATRNAGTIAGLDVKRIINEPTAAALAYGLDSGDLKGKDVKVLVFDLGGGTFDVSMLRIEGGIFEVLATGGDTHLGGEDFDQNIVDYLAAEFNKKNKGKDVKTNARAMKRLKAHAERAKRVLSSATVTHVEIEDLLEGCDFNAALSRAKFENLNLEPFNRCMDAVKNVMKDAKMSVSEVDEIVLVGGSTRIPKVQQNLITFFEGKELNKSINPDEAVAYGAAVQGAILSGIKDPAHSSLLLVDVTPLSLGIEMSGRVMSTIIKRNTAIPVRRTKVYTTEEDFQERVDIPIFEGERACTDGNNKLGDFTISGIQRAKRGVAQIEVTFDLDANGILSVTAKDLVTMASANITITNENRLSEAEIDKMVADAEKYKALDAQHTARVESRNELERLVYNVMEGAKASKNLDMVTKVSDFRDWLEANPEASSIDLDEKRHQLERIINRK